VLRLPVRILKETVVARNAEGEGGRLIVKRLKGFNGLRVSGERFLRFRSWFFQLHKPDLLALGLFRIFFAAFERHTNPFCVLHCVMGLQLLI